ncbi:hypothetical protein K458DRAFT_410998 [Lentithecium fluviatile CBS 122367]|uniref:Uncharacterized protein n=1 Tax=Lentithecium fluviatile CBS 122367 TaxID=1168545 RepID=A0A6G1ICQ7_9PLEO|nr:hypothetical protein K458DRAFT_410998 [Lentithecium fluviatile CBS 122367]
MRLNWAIFIFFRATCPWKYFAPSTHGKWQAGIGTLTFWGLICLSIAILALRRLPVVLCLYGAGLLTPNVQSLIEALFMGYFGPIGVSAIFYLHVAMWYLERGIRRPGGSEGELREDVEALFYVISSVIVHGLSIFSCRAWVWVMYHSRLWRNAVQEKHAFHVRQLWRHEVAAVKHFRWKSKLEGEDEATRRAMLEEHPPPRTPNPTFRRVGLET